MLFALKALQIVALPLLELLAFRVFFLPNWGIRVGFPGFTDYELFLPALLGFGAFLWKVDQRYHLQLKLRRNPVVVHLFFLGLFMALNISHLLIPPVWFYPSWWILIIPMICSAFLIFIGPEQLMRVCQLGSLVPALLMVFSVVIYFKWGGKLFENSIEIWANALKYLVRLFTIQNIQIYPFTNMVQIYHPLWAVHIGRGCAGFDSLLFFLGAFALFIPMYWERHSVFQWIIFFLVGGLFSLLLNFVRILILFMTGLFLMRWLPKSSAISLTLNLFHIHIGYLLYGFGLATYFQIIFALKSPSFETEQTRQLQKPSPI